MSVIEDLAQRAGEYVWGIPWDNITSDAYRDVYTEVQYIIPLREAMRSVFEFADEINWTWDVVRDPNNEDATAAWYGIRNSIIDDESIIFATLQANATTLLGGKAIPFDIEIMRAFVSQVFSQVMRTYYIHHNLIFQYGGADPSVIVKNADFVHAMCRGLRLLWDWGILNSLRKERSESATSGLGALAQGAVVAIVVGSVSALVIIAYMIITLSKVDSQYKLAKDICQEAMADPSNEVKVKACRDAQKAINEAGGQKDPFDVANTLAIFAGLGILLWVGAQVLPDLLVGIKRSRYR